MGVCTLELFPVKFVMCTNDFKLAVNFLIFRFKYNIIIPDVHRCKPSIYYLVVTIWGFTCCNLVQLQGVDEPQRKFFWPAELLQHNEEESDDEEEDYADEDDADDLLSVSNAQCR